MMAGKVFAVSDRRVALSMLWVFVVFNYLYADIVIMVFRPGVYESIAARMSPLVTLGATLLMEVLLIMALLSRVLEPSVNRQANIIAGLIGTGFVAMTITPRAPLAYLTLAGIEAVSTLFIVWYAWTWRPPPRSLG